MASSNHKKIADDVLAKVQALAVAGSLTGITSTNVVEMQVPTDEAAEIAAFPCISISAFGTEDVDSIAAVTKSEFVEYPIMVAIVDSAGENNDLVALEKRLKWREVLVDTLVKNKTIFTTAGRVIRTFISPVIIIDPGSWYANSQFVSAFVLNVTIKIARTT